MQSALGGLRNQTENDMQRQYFTVTSDRGHSEVRYKWNSSLRATLGIVRQVARDEGVTYQRDAWESRKDDTGHVWGRQTWTGTNGKSITMTIFKN
jgi:hypothetical protein